MSDTIAIGFVGFQQDDLAIWCSVFFAGMNKKVLLMDFTMEESLGYLFPLPKGYAQVKDMEFEYRGIFYVNADVDTRLEEFSSEYDIVIAAFGEKISHPDLKHCNALYVVTNPETRKIKYLKEMKHYTNQYLVVRNFFKMDNMDRFLMQELGYQKDDTFLLERNDAEYRQFIRGQWNQEIEMRTLSYETRELLIHIAEQTQVDRKQCKIALKLAMKGKVS